MHELGHSLGLAHSPVADSVMFPYYRGAVGKDFQLGYDDILAMYELYSKLCTRKVGLANAYIDINESTLVAPASTATDR